MKRQQRDWTGWAGGVVLVLCGCAESWDPCPDCLSGGAPSTSSGASGTGEQGETVVAVGPAEGPCVSTPSLLVSPSTYPVPSDIVPSPVVSVVADASGLVVNASYLYYVIHVREVVVSGSGYGQTYLGGVLRVPVVGGEPTVVESGYGFARPIFTETNMILGESDTMSSTDGESAIHAIPLAGGTKATLAFPDDAWTGLAADETSVYFSDFSGDLSRINAVPLAGGLAASNRITLPLPIAVESYVGDIGVFGDRLVFFVVPEGYVASVPLPLRADSTVTTLDSDFPDPDHLIPCGSDVCWSARDSQELLAILRMAPEGGPITALPLPRELHLAFLVDMAFDGTHFYLMGRKDSATLELFRMNSDGSGPISLVTMPTTPGDPLITGGSLALDERCLYWSNGLGIFSLAKTAKGPFAQ